MNHVRLINRVDIVQTFRGKTFVLLCEVRSYGKSRIANLSHCSTYTEVVHLYLIC